MTRKSLKKDLPSESEEEEYVVEGILADRRGKGGTREYLIKWLGYDESECTWEAESNTNCPDLIAEYEIKKQEKEKKKRSNIENEVAAAKKSRKGSVNSETTTDFDENTARGFDRGLQPEKIIGATDSSGDLMFLMKWKNSDEADLVLAKTANVRCPQIVIQFYEERLTWHTSNDDKDDQPSTTSRTETLGKVN